jgi:hypothetical protein
VGLVHSFHTFLRVATGRNEVRRVRGELQHTLEGTSDDIAMNVIFFGESSRHCVYLFVSGLVLARLLLDTSSGHKKPRLLLPLITFFWSSVYLPVVVNSGGYVVNAGMFINEHPLISLIILNFSASTASCSQTLRVTGLYFVYVA